jgi:hypothetical protein
MKKMQYSLIVLELEDVVPRRDPSKPNLYVSLTGMSLNDRFALLNNGHGPDWLSGNILQVRKDLSIENLSHDHGYAKTLKTSSIATLRSRGYTVNRNTDLWTVYVIELDPAATKNPGVGYVYVGETKKLPEQRFEEHRNRSINGKTRLFSPVVANHGQRLRMDLAPRTRFFDKQASKEAEAKWAEHLRSRGYTVKGGH